MTSAEVELALQRIERGEGTVEEASLLRNYIAGLESRLRVLALEQDDGSGDGTDRPEMGGMFFA